MSTVADPFETLTPAEREVAELVARGLSNRQVAAERCTGEQAVRYNLTNIYRKIGVSTRSELAAVAAGNLVTRIVYRDIPADEPADVDQRELQALRVEVEELRMAPRFAPRRWQPDKPPTRQSLAVAVRRVGTARGRRETVQRLHELAAEAEAWAARVDSRCNPDPTDALQGRTTT